MKYKFVIKMRPIVVEAETHEEAEKLAQEKLEYWAGSNTGSEELADAKLECISYA